ncbi:SpoIID/LytB domain-containing protein [Altericista sp. CCNU0014]|uniref:SpoIID/LytB domain-containing protein n=1 Tax=Altericista sp. CCNU0014 TaxID=3082949 RepID=UPI00384D3AE3
MLKAFNASIQSLRIWHIAPLFLPLLLGSTSARTSPAISTPAIVPPVPTSVLIDRELAKFRQQPQPLPSQVLSTFSRPSLSKPKPQAIATVPQSQAKAPKTQRASSSSSSPASAPPQATLAALSAPKPARNLPFIPLRVAIAFKAKTLSITTSDNGAIADGNGRVLGQLAAQTGVAVTPTPDGLQVGDWQTPSTIWVKPKTARGLVFLEGRWYRGAVQIVAQADGLLAVNHVDLEAYLYSVVGAEMPAFWSAEALKAQAVAARSYALVHMARHADELYDLGATPRWQAYNGAESETNTTQAAVNDTRGILLSYQGGVVESLYASSIDIVRDVHGGFGMSQEGANQLAQKNFSYPQILGHFYPGTSLAVLNIK